MSGHGAICRGVVAMLAGVAMATAQAAPTSVRSTGLFSNLHAIPESGDVLGMEIFIVPGGERGDYALLQCAEGWPGRPVLVTATLRGAEVELAAHDDEGSHCPRARFVGRVSARGLSGRFEGLAAPVVLPRRRSFWQ